jgi:hypothetical protein
MKYDFFWVFPRRLGANSRRFGTLYEFHLQKQVKEEFFFDLPLKMEPIQCSETSAISTEMPGKHPKEIIFHTSVACKKKYVHYYFLDTVFNPAIINGEIYYSPSVKKDFWSYKRKRWYMENENKQ